MCVRCERADDIADLIRDYCDNYKAPWDSEEKYQAMAAFSQALKEGKLHEYDSRLKQVRAHGCQCPCSCGKSTRDFSSTFVK